MVSPRLFFFFYMPGYIEKEILDIVCSRFPTFKLGFSKTVNGKYWANHCEHCNALQGDFSCMMNPVESFLLLTWMVTKL